MSDSQPLPRKHHFVPRSLLRYFKAPGPDEYMFTFDKRSRKSFRASLMNTGSQNDYNSLEQGEEVVNFEKEFDEADAMLAERLVDIHSLKMDALRTARQRADWIDLFAVQILRSPVVRSTISSSMVQLSSSVQELLGKQAPIPSFTENDGRIAARGLFHERDDISRSLSDKDFILFEAAGNETFRISDRPVCISNPDPYGGLGLACPSVIIAMPLGPRLMLALLSPNLRYRLNRRPLEELGLPADLLFSVTALRDALSSGAPMKWSDVEVKRHNTLQVIESSRFIYGPTDDFSDVVAIMNTDPRVGELHTFIQVGRIGHGPGPCATMSPGQWLVLFGKRDSYMLRVADFADAWPLEFTVTNETTLTMALEDGPFSELQYFVDRHQRRGMRDVAAERSSTDPRRVIIRHGNEGLNGLMSALHKAR